MNLQIWAELIGQLMGQYDANTKFDDRMIFALTDTCRGQIIAEIFRQTGKMPTGDYIRSFKVNLLPDPDTGLMKFNLPIAIANGVGDLGIRSISNTKFVECGKPAGFKNWLPTQAGKTSQFREEDYGGRPVYWLEGSTIYAAFTNGATEALIKLIPSLAAPEMDQLWEIFGNSEIEGRVRDMVMRSLMIKKETPKLGDNNGRP